MAEVVELYFEDSAGKLDKLEGKLAAPTPDFNDIDQLVHQFKGSSASFGAQKLAALCVQVSLPSGPSHYHCRGKAAPSCMPSRVFGRSEFGCDLQLRDGCMKSDRQLCQALLQEVKKNFAVLKSKLEIFMQLETQRKQLMRSMQ